MKFLLNGALCSLIVVSLTQTAFANSEPKTQGSQSSTGQLVEDENIQIYDISEDHKVAYRYSPAKDGKSTLVLLNGLIYSLSYWNNYYARLANKGYGVLLVGYSTQPESLSALNDDVDPYFGIVGLDPSGSSAGSLSFALDGLSTQDLVDEVMSLVDSLSIDKFDLVSLSYSSIVASELAVQNKNRIGSLVLQAPAVLPANRYNQIGAAKHQNYVLQKSININPFIDIDYLYDFEIYTAMYPILYSQYTTNKGRLTTLERFLNGVYQMARSAKWFDLKDYAGEDLPKTFLFLASKEEEALFADQNVFWDLMSSNPAKATKVLFKGSQHALPASAPGKAAEYTIKAIEGELKNEDIEIDAK